MSGEQVDKDAPEHRATLQHKPRSIRLTCPCGWTTRAPNMHLARLWCEQHNRKSDEGQA